MKRLLLTLFLILLLAGAAIGVYRLLLTEYWQGAGILTAPKEVLIAKGASSKDIIALLAREHIIEYPLLFRAFATSAGDVRSYKAGEYRFDLYLSPEAISRQLVKGEVIERSLTIPEGWIAAQVIAALVKEPLLEGTLPEALLEGSLLPETYFFTRGQLRTDLTAQMQRALTQTLQRAWEGRQPDLPLKTAGDALILASIVEKETGVSAERPHIASVFLNRLRANMPLQSDPTANYGIYLEQGALKLRLNREDVAHQSAYNTYIINGLPPTPICNAGRASIDAVLHPLKTNDLYFVADGKGGHVFAPTLAEHNRNVAAYRKAMRAP
jgi:UPF0755 protein